MVGNPIIKRKRGGNDQPQPQKQSRILDLCFIPQNSLFFPAVFSALNAFPKKRISPLLYSAISYFLSPLSSSSFLIKLSVSLLYNMVCLSIPVMNACNSSHMHPCNFGFLDQISKLSSCIYNFIISVSGICMPS